MAIRDALLPEFDFEMANTRKTLERVTDEVFAYKPHPKSMGMGALATHIGNLPLWAVMALKESTLDLAPVGGQPIKLPSAENRNQVLENFDRHCAEARRLLSESDDAHMMQTWTMLRAGQKLMEIPRVGVVRTWVMNHIVHHRAQLGVYLRLNDIPVPALYGPSADEGAGF